MYPTGGYAAVLGRTTYNSYFNLGYLVTKQWLDMATRMVCLEFLTYNVNYNVFNSVKLIFEKTASGYFDQAYTVCALKKLKKIINLFLHNTHSFLVTSCFPGHAHY